MFISGPLDVLHQILAPYTWNSAGWRCPPLPVAAVPGHGAGQNLLGGSEGERDSTHDAARGRPRVCVQGDGGGLTPGQAFVLLSAKEGEGENAPAGYLAPLRQALIDRNGGHVNVFVCESDYRALNRGIEDLAPGVL